MTTTTKKKPVKPKKFVNQYNYKYNPKKGEINGKPSLTIPGQSHTIQELIERHSRGIPLTYDDRLEWGGESEPFVIKDLTDLDIAKQYLSDLKDRIAKITSGAVEPENVQENEEELTTEQDSEQEEVVNAH